MNGSRRRDEQNGWKRLLTTKPNTRVIMTLMVALTVALAGCAGGLGGSDSEAGVAEAETPSDGASSTGGEADSADGAGESGSGDGADANAGSENNELAKTNIEPREEDWYNTSKNGYVFEFTDANGSGTVTFEPPADPEELETVTYEGDAQFEEAYAARVEERGDAGTPILYPLSVVSTFFSVDNEDLAVGYENTTADGSLTTKITGVESYGGVECYATEVSINGERRLETCVVPYDEDVLVIYDIPPYMALYDEETGELALEIKLTEMREE